MARLARVVAVDTPHHVTKEAMAVESFSSPIPTASSTSTFCASTVVFTASRWFGYCLMSNHIHLVAIPRRTDSLLLALKHTHGRYATYFNALHASSGHAWQGRY
jgi:putative transposase